MPQVKQYDLTDVEVNEDGFTPYDGPTPKKGTYSAVIKSAKQDKSSAGNDMIVAILEIQDEPYKGAPLWLYLTFSDAALPIVKRTLQALNIPLKGTLQKWATQMEGKKCRVVVKNEMYNNEVTAKPSRILPAKKDSDIGDEGDTGSDDSGDSTGDDEPPF